MKLFNTKGNIYELYTDETWGGDNSEEVVIKGTKKEIQEYAEKVGFVWNKDSSKIMGGFYSKGIDGYRQKNYQLRESN
jgi:hypothetical protein|tara:strand:- start:219 stop:452 length:234 start_codon:yes stop_codon:yes gene_type:complete